MRTVRWCTRLANRRASRPRPASWSMPPAPVTPSLGPSCRATSPAAARSRRPRSRPASPPGLYSAWAPGPGATSAACSESSVAAEDGESQVGTVSDYAACAQVEQRLHLRFVIDRPDVKLHVPFFQSAYEWPGDDRDAALADRHLERVSCGAGGPAQAKQVQDQEVANLIRAGAGGDFRAQAPELLQVALDEAGDQYGPFTAGFTEQVAGRFGHAGVVRLHVDVDADIRERFEHLAQRRHDQAFTTVRVITVRAGPVGGGIQLLQFT